MTNTPEINLDTFTLAPLVPGKKPSETTVVVAMSGGVDSSAVAAILKHFGYNVIGMTLQLWDYTPASDGGKKFGTCCALDDVYDARRVCQTMDVPHYVLNYESEFKDKVIDDFVDTYLSGATPIPCVRCNQRIKFDSLLEKAKRLGADVLATGHYVRKIQAEGQNPQLHRGYDDGKDQSYFLFTTTLAQLEATVFPLGHLTKPQTRELARQLGLHVSVKKESQDICFVPGGDYRKVVRKFAPEADKPGNFVTSDGKVLGQHDGIINFTVGQRRGLGMAFGAPVYVVAIRPETHEVVVGPKEELATQTFTASEVNWIGDGALDGQEVTVKVRAAHKPIPATLHDLGHGRVQVMLHTPEDAVAPGQAVVFYGDERMLGGGWIDNPNKAAKLDGKPIKVNITAA